MAHSSTILDLPAVLRVMFYPRRSWPGISLVSSAHDGRVEVEPGVCVGYSLYPALSRSPERGEGAAKGPAEPQSPLILYFHGNGEVARDYDSIALLYTNLGISLMVADYRGYGWSDGLPTASSLVHDAPRIFEALGRILEEAGSEVPQRVFVMGRSLGSAAAIEVARLHQEAIAGLIIESGFAHTARLLARLGVVLEDLDEPQDVFANLSKIGQISLPTLVIHGQADVLIPASEGVALYEGSAAPEDKKRLVVIPGAGHNDLLVDADTYFEAIRDFVLG